MIKRTLAILLVLILSLSLFACKKNQYTDSDGDYQNNPPVSGEAGSNGNNIESTTFPPVAMKDGWPIEGILSKLPAYKYAGSFDQPLMPDTYLIDDASPAGFDSYCNDLVNAGFTKKEDSSANSVTRYVFEKADLNLLVTVAYWKDYKQIEILAENLDGSIDYSNKKTLNVDFSSFEYLALLPQYTQGGRIIEASKESEKRDFVKIVDAALSDFNAYKESLLQAGFVKGSIAHEGWHNESFYYSHPDHASFTVELYYDINGQSTNNIVIGIVALGEAIV